VKWIWYFVFFSVLYLFFTTLFNFWISASTEEGRFYIPFVHKYLNFPSKLRYVLLNTSSLFVCLFGYTTVVGEYTLKIVGGSSARMVYTCIGYSHFSFWLAMVIPFQGRSIRKVIVLLIGVAVIFVLNTVRIGGLVMLLTEGKTALFKYIDHHTILNLTTYPLLIAVFLLFFKPLRRNKP
jgi:exosortase/archaeosortase family protein